MSGTPANWTKAVENWFNEVSAYSYPNGTPGKVTGHYTQVSTNNLIVRKLMRQISGGLGQIIRCRLWFQPVLQCNNKMVL